MHMLNRVYENSTWYIFLLQLKARYHPQYQITVTKTPKMAVPLHLTWNTFFRWSSLSIRKSMLACSHHQFFLRSWKRRKCKIGLSYRMLGLAFIIHLWKTCLSYSMPCPWFSTLCLEYYLGRITLKGRLGKNMTDEDG